MFTSDTNYTPVLHELSAYFQNTGTPMDLEYAVPDTPSEYLITYYEYVLPLNATTGTYAINAQAYESNGVVDVNYTQASVPAGVEIWPYAPELKNTTWPGTTVQFQHIIKNLGDGYDIFAIYVETSYPVNVTIYTDPNGDGNPSDGEIMGWDYNGDGDWNDALDYVNPKWDTDGDGVPDTGLLAPGQTFCIVKSCTLPSGIWARFWINITVVSVYVPTVSAMSVNIIEVIPEFSWEMIPVLLPLVIFIAVDARRKRRSKKKSQ